MTSSNFWNAKRGWALVAMLALATGCQSNLEHVKARSIKPVKDRAAAPDFALKDAHGRTVKLSDYKGKVVLLNFWATNCGPCKIEIPWFVEFEKEFKDQGFAVLGISVDEDGWDAVKPYIERRQINYRIAVADEPTANAYGGIEAIPTTFIIDREGRTASVHVGLISKDDYRNDIVQVLEATTATQ